MSPGVQQKDMGHAQFAKGGWGDFWDWAWLEAKIILLVAAMPHCITNVQFLGIFLRK